MDGFHVRRQHKTAPRKRGKNGDATYASSVATLSCSCPLFLISLHCSAPSSLGVCHPRHLPPSFLWPSSNSINFNFNSPDFKNANPEDCRTLDIAARLSPKQILPLTCTLVNELYIKKDWKNQNQLNNLTSITKHSGQSNRKRSSVCEAAVATGTRSDTPLAHNTPHTPEGEPSLFPNPSQQSLLHDDVSIR